MAEWVWVKLLLKEPKLRPFSVDLYEENQFAWFLYSPVQSRIREFLFNFGFFMTGRGVGSAAVRFGDW